MCPSKDVCVRSGLFLVLLIINAVAVALGLDFALETVDCRTGRELAAAFASGSCNVAYISVDITLQNADWADFNGNPVARRRNFTIASSDGKLRTLDLNYVSAKVQLFDGAVLHMRNVIVANARRKPLNVSPGMDLLVPSASPEAGTEVVMQNGLLILRQCFPLAYMRDNYVGLARPPGVPGKQLLNFSVPQTGCVNDTRASPEQRCWASRGLYQDVVFDAKEMTSDDRQFPSNYTVRLLNTSFACSGMLTTECLKLYGPGGCVMRSLSTATFSDGIDGSSTSAGGSTTDEASDGQARKGGCCVLPVVLACSLGGAALLASAGALGLWVLYRRRRRFTRFKNIHPTKSRSPDRQNSTQPSKDTADDVVISRGTAGVSIEKGNKPNVDERLTLYPAGEMAIEIGADACSNSDLMQQQDVPTGLGPKATSSLPEAPALVSPTTPLRPDVTLLGAQCTNEVKLEPVCLGKGSFGRVVVGVYGGTRVAVKLIGDGGELLLGTPHGDSLLQALRREVEVLGRCQHPNVVRLLAACVEAPRACLVMELLETSLESLLKERQLPLQTVLHIALDIARGLEYLHPTILHRDLKPANVLLSNANSPRPTAKLADFGLSRLHTTAIYTRHTEAGTPAYMAPECFDPENYTVTHKADIYAFGVMLAEMLSGKMPWRGVNLAQLACQVALMGKRPVNLKEVAPDRCPNKLRRLVNSCWETDPQRRLAAAEVVKILLLIREQVSSKAPAAAARAATATHPAF